MQLFQGIEAETRLCVAKVMARLHCKPEVAEGIGELAALAPFRLVESLSLPHDERSRMLLARPEQMGNILREMLAVGIHRYGIGETHPDGFLEAAFQGGTLALILIVGHNGNAVNAPQDVWRIVRTTVADNYHVLTLCECPAYDIGNGSRIIVGGNHHAYTAFVKEHLCICHLIN